MESVEQFVERMKEIQEEASAAIAIAQDAMKRQPSGRTGGELPARWRRIHPVFNEVLLTPAHAPEFPNQVRDLPVPDLVAPGLQPEEILDSKLAAGTIFYYVKWKNRTRAEATWEPRTPKLTTLTADFHRRFPAALCLPFICIPPPRRFVDSQGREG
ncbi:hypothetical protein BN946_scf184892.g1 [Trametes cinnabarina]|uniref:Chromo domain-containing protein n=1 Tax=Pycnoporus cinnabarinus TaxID=5643 RepID=A0A060SV39_PYCCI|nr:hypothetical protein BN946_scf184892.g1 [Trametes cinnabarina]